MIRKLSSLGCLVGLSFVPCAQATPVIVVTATKTEQAIEDIDASVQVISREQIEQFSGRSLTEILQYGASLQVHDSGSGSRVSIRGFDDKHTLILVDGLRRTEKYAGANLNNISLENVERIEIVRGPMSSLYGSDALGGVINIITRRPETNQTRARINLGNTTAGDGRETALLHLGRDIVLDKSRHSFGFEYKNRDSYEGPSGRLNDEERLFANYMGQFELAEETSMRLGLEYVNQDDSHPDRTTGRFERDKRYTLTAQYHQPLFTGDLDVDASYGKNDSLVNRGTGDETSDIQQTQLEARYSDAVGDDHWFNFGVGYRKDDVDISINQQDAKRDIYHLYLQDQWQINPDWHLTLGLRHDDYSDFGSSLNPRLSLSWQRDGWMVRAGYGEAFVAPTFIEMYSSFSRGGGTSIIEGNPNLKPENANTYELSVRKQWDSTQLEITAYHSMVDDLIETSLERVQAGTRYWRSNNISEARIQGAELDYKWHIDANHRFNFGVEYLDARDEEDDSRLTSRARWQARFSVDSSWNTRLKTSLRARYLGDFYESNGGRRDPLYNSDATIFDGQVQYQMTPEVSWFTGVQNLFDQELPLNMSFRGQAQDPGSRYVYTGLQLAF